MNEASILKTAANENDGFMTTAQIAKHLGTSPYVVTKNAKKCLPNKKIENGKVTYWNQAEVTVLLDFMKTNNNRTDLDLTHRVVGSSTDLTPALKIKKAMELMQEGYEEELAILRAKTEAQQRQLSEQEPKVEMYERTMSAEGTYAMSDAAKILKLPFGNVTLFKKLREMGLLKSDNSPMQEYVNRGYFIEITTPVVMGTKIVNKPVTRVTAKGLEYVSKKLKLTTVAINTLQHDDV